MENINKMENIDNIKNCCSEISSRLLNDSDFSIIDKTDNIIYESNKENNNPIITFYIDNNESINKIIIDSYNINNSFLAKDIIPIMNEFLISFDYNKLPGYFTSDDINNHVELNKLNDLKLKIHTDEHIDISALSENSNIDLIIMTNDDKASTKNIIFPRIIRSLKIISTNKKSCFFNIDNLINYKILRISIDSNLSSNLIDNLNKISNLAHLFIFTNHIDCENITITNQELIYFSLHDFTYKTNSKNIIKYLNITSKNLLELLLYRVSSEFIHIESKNLHRIEIEKCLFKKNNFTSIFNLPNIREISIDNTSIIIDDIETNQSLLKLLLVNNGLSNIDFIKKLEVLQTLSINENNLEKLPNTLNASIKMAVFNNCGLVNIPKEIAINYRAIVNNMSTILTNNDSEKIISLNNNPIENPPLELLTQNEESIKQYFDSMEGETTTLNEAKIIFVGDGSVGKTSLIKRLIENKFNIEEEQTDGIDIQTYDIKLKCGTNISSSIWDFGGQQILQATHQLFLSKRSIYVLVVEDRKNDLHKDHDIDKWLTQINSLGGNPCVLIVKNKIDENPNSDIQKNKLKLKFKNIHSFHEISCKTMKGFSNLKKSLDSAIINLPMRKIELPINWINVKNDLKIKSNKDDLLYLNTYDDICNKYDIKSEIAKSTLLHLLHDLGSVIAFEELSSHNTAILNPHWITEGIYALLRSNILISKNGIITKNQAQEALDNYVDNLRFSKKAQYILDAMITFDLCHRTSNIGEFLIPILLPPQIEFSQFLFEDSGTEKIKFIFNFEHLLPPSLMPMLIVKLHEKIIGNYRWRTGALISSSNYNATALIDADIVKKEISICVIGSERRNLFISLRESIKDLINKISSAQTLGMQELIPLDNNGTTVTYKHLIGLQVMGDHDYACSELGQRISISQLLGEIEPPEDTAHALNILMKNNKNGLFNIHMKNNISQNNKNNATGGSASNTVTQTQQQENTVNLDLKLEIKKDLTFFKGQSDFILDDILDEIDEIDNCQDKIKKRAKKECEKVSEAIDVLEKNVEDKDSAEKNIKHFSRIQNFLSGALSKASNVGKVIEKADDIYNQVESLAQKYNELATKLSMPLVAIASFINS